MPLYPQLEWHSRRQRRHRRLGPRRSPLVLRLLLVTLVLLAIVVFTITLIATKGL